MRTSGKPALARVSWHWEPVLFVLLQMEQSALVLGSVLLFAVPAGVMVATRRLDWHTLLDNLRVEAGRTPVPAQ